ncbi:mucin-5B-like [Diadema setosum]|uniref:mucin-5B-like n=1 Tax=Diadema setosum TaxID=31175 RepID=UPI003B3B264A
MPDGNVTSSTDGVGVAQPAGAFTSEFSTTVVLAALRIEVLQDLQAQEPVGFELHYKREGGTWQLVTDAGTDTVTEFLIPPDTMAGDTLEFNVSNLLPPDVTDVKIQFTRSGQFGDFTFEPTFEYCVTIDQCLPRQRGCKANGNFYLFDEQIPSPDGRGCVEMTCSADDGFRVQPVRCNTTCNGNLIYVEDQCCPRCEALPEPQPTTSCEVSYTEKIIMKGQCRSTQPVRVGTCSGTCESSEDENRVVDCRCCQVLQTTFQDVEMECGSSGGAYTPSDPQSVEFVTQCMCMECENGRIA